ncbi:MAG: hypothetical protein GQ574_28610 [Crocinitomix sp.]|nr:hypothetical protein [Crocinitomix sp.]
MEKFRLLSILSILILTGILNSCGSIKDTTFDINPHAYADSIAQRLKIAGWSEAAINEFYPLSLKESIFSDENQMLYLIPDWAQDTILKVWYVKEDHVLFKQSWNKNRIRTCAFNSDFTDQFCVTHNENNDTLSTSKSTRKENSTIHLDERFIYWPDGTLQNHLIQSDSLNKRCSYSKFGMPLESATIFIDSIITINDTTAITYSHSEKINGQEYWLNGYEYIGRKIIFCNISIITFGKFPIRIYTGIYQEYSLYSKDINVAPISYLSLEGKHDSSGNRIGRWIKYDEDGIIIEEKVHDVHD